MTSKQDLKLILKMVKVLSDEMLEEAKMLIEYEQEKRLKDKLK